MGTLLAHGGHALPKPWSQINSMLSRRIILVLATATFPKIYLHGAKTPTLISPENWESDYGFMQRAHATRLNLDLFYDYRKNVALYPKWQAFLRERQPKTIIFWGQHDIFFTPEGGEAYLTDLPNAEIHRLDAGHFAVEDHLDYISTEMQHFYTTKVANGKARVSIEKLVQPASR